MKEGRIRLGAYFVHVGDHVGSDMWELGLEGMSADPFDVSNLAMMADFQAKDVIYTMV